MALTKVTKKIPLNLKGMDKGEKLEVKERVGRYLVDAIIADTDNLTSSVTGRGFVKLSKEYAKIKAGKGKAPVPDLQLTEKMLRKLTYETKYNRGVEFGIFDEKQAQKADNHNKFSGKSKRTAVPRRAFIPRKEESFRPVIRKEIVKIVKEYRKELGLRVNKESE